MVDRKGEIAERYVQRHLEPPNQKSFDRTPIVNPDKSLAETLLETSNVQTPYFIFHGFFTPIDPGDFCEELLTGDKEKSMLEKPAGALPDKEKNTQREAEVNSIWWLLKNKENIPVVRIDGLLIKGNNNIIDLQSLVPGYTIIWNPNGRSHGDKLFIERKIIILTDDVTSPEGLLIAFHEIGHALAAAKDAERKDALLKVHRQVHKLAVIRDIESRGENSEIYQELMEEFKEKYGEGAQMMFSFTDILNGWRQSFEANRISDEDMSIFLEAERDAWAFALRTISKLTEDRELVKKLQEYIHKDVMISQSDLLRLIKLVKN